MIAQRPLAQTESCIANFYGVSGGENNIFKLYKLFFGSFCLFEVSWRKGAFNIGYAINLEEKFVEGIVIFFHVLACLKC